MVSDLCVVGKRALSPRSLRRFASFKSNNASRDAVVFEDNHLLVVKAWGMLDALRQTRQNAIILILYVSYEEMLLHVKVVSSRSIMHLPCSSHRTSRILLCYCGLRLAGV